MQNRRRKYKKAKTHLSSLSLLEVVSELSSKLIIAFCSHGEKHCGVVGVFEFSDDVGDKRICSCFTITFVNADDEDDDDNDEVVGGCLAVTFTTTELPFFNLCNGLSLPTISILL